MNVYIFKQVSPSLKGPLQPLQLYAIYGPMFFLLTVLAFRCPLSVYSQIDSWCGKKIIAVFVSAKNTLSRHQPTNPDPGSVSTTSIQNKQPPAPMQATKTISPRRQESRNSAAPNERQQDIQQPKT